MYRRISLAQAVVAIAIAGTAPAHAADAGTLDVRVRDISPSALVVSIASMAGIAFIAGSELPTQRVSIDERSLNPREWMERFAAERVATKMQNGILLIASECRRAHAGAPIWDDGDTVSLSYQNSGSRRSPPKRSRSSSRAIASNIPTKTRMPPLLYQSAMPTAEAPPPSPRDRLGGQA